VLKSSVNEITGIFGFSAERYLAKFHEYENATTALA
jgi:hypothetical protein